MCERQFFTFEIEDCWISFYTFRNWSNVPDFNEIIEQREKSEKMLKLILDLQKVSILFRIETNSFSSRHIFLLFAKVLGVSEKKMKTVTLWNSIIKLWRAEEKILRDNWIKTDKRGEE